MRGVASGGPLADIARDLEALHPSQQHVPRRGAARDRRGRDDDRRLLAGDARRLRRNRRASPRRASGQREHGEAEDALRVVCRCGAARWSPTGSARRRGLVSGRRLLAVLDVRRGDSDPRCGRTDCDGCATCAGRSRGNPPSLSMGRPSPPARRLEPTDAMPDARASWQSRRHATYGWWVSWWALWWAFNSAIGAHQRRRAPAARDRTRRSEPCRESVHDADSAARGRRRLHAFGTAGRHPSGAMTQECDASAPARRRARALGRSPPDHLGGSALAEPPCMLRVVLDHQQPHQTFLARREETGSDRALGFAHNDREPIASPHCPAAQRHPSTEDLDVNVRRDRTLSDKEQPVTEPIERPLVYTVTQTALLLGISRTHACSSSRGELAHVRLGRRIVVPRQALERLLDVVAERSAGS